MPITIGSEGGIDCRPEVIEHMRGQINPVPSAYDWLKECCSCNHLGYDFSTPWTVSHGGKDLLIASDGALLALIPLHFAAGHSSETLPLRKRPPVKSLLATIFSPEATYQEDRIRVRGIELPQICCPEEFCEAETEDGPFPTNTCIASGVCHAWSKRAIPIPGVPKTLLAAHYLRRLAQIDAEIRIPKKQDHLGMPPNRFSGHVGDCPILGLLMPMKD